MVGLTGKGKEVGQGMGGGKFLVGGWMGKVGAMVLWYGIRKVAFKSGGF